MKQNQKTQNKILLVEDESALRKGIALNLKAEGYDVVEFPDSSSVIKNLSAIENANLGIFDVMMPGTMDGMDLCQYLRSNGFEFPVIFLTARDQLEDKLKGFEVGGDDYMTKPFDLEELLARIQVRIQRKTESRSNGEIRIGDFTVDLQSRIIQGIKDKKVIRLNERETGILALLINHRGKPVSRDMILDEVWGTDEFPTNRTIDNYIVKFRKIFEPEPTRPKYIITRHGTGYELAP